MSWCMRLAPFLLLLTLGLHGCIASGADAKPAEGQPTDPPALPQAEGDAAPTISLGQKVKLDSLGPAIITEEGTLRRVTNWDELTEAEKDTFKRRILQRNKERVDAIKKLATEATLNASEQAQGTAAEEYEDDSEASDGSKGSKSKDGDTEELDEIDKKYQDVTDFKRMSPAERAAHLKKIGEQGKKAFAHRLAKYHKEKSQKMTPEEKQQRMQSGNQVLDRASPRLREKLIELLRQAKADRGGSKEDVKQALAKTMKDSLRKVQEQQERQRAKVEALLASLQDDDEHESGAAVEDDEYLIELEEAKELRRQEEEVVDAPPVEHDEL